MNDLLRKHLPALWTIRPDAHLEEVFVIDQLMSDGRSVGACFKLVFRNATVFVFPERRWCSADRVCPPDVATAMDKWLHYPLNDPV